MIGAIVLAAGRSTRFGEENKLLAEWGGKPLVRHVVDAALASQLDRVVVVTGHEPELVEAALQEGIATIQNYEFREGMAGSIRAGSYRLQGHMHVMVLLGDMPLVTSQHIDRMIAAFDGERIVAATCDGEIGNPVLFPKTQFAPLKCLDGDRGARSLMSENSTITVEIGQAAARDFDTQDELIAHSTGPNTS
ncbi:bifunctional protein GlmU [Ahrensia sp. R2A130]|nr:bifunctional protein GlmU [Ahrensia sp. R2A130]